jgi:hypothetical protein
MMSCSEGNSPMFAQRITFH